MLTAGSDESGKGDYFGPLVVAAFVCTKDDERTLQELDKLSRAYNIQLLKGASAQVKALRASIAPEILPYVVKMHFKP